MLKIYKPTTAGRRGASVVINKELSRERPEKSLTAGKITQPGRSHGRISVRHKGAGEKKLYRQIDFRQEKFDIPAKVKTIEYDPNRSAWISLVIYADGEKRYILTPGGLKIGQTVVSSKNKIEPETGNRMPLKYIPTSYSIHNVELEVGHGGKMVHSAGLGAVLMTCENGYAQVKVPSGEIRLIPEDCSASIGSVSNPEHRLIRWGKAGRMRHRGIRPSVRGKAMAPVAHPHGGGEGHNPIGLVHPKTPWGKPALGPKTRKKHRWTTKLILKRRR